MIVELVGLPGAGKSTIASSLLQSINNINTKVIFFQDERRNNSHRKSKLSLFLLLNLLALIKLVLHIMKTMKLNELRLNFPRLKKLIILLFDLSEMNKKYSKDVVLMDQGIIQMLASFPTFQGGNNTERVIPIYESIKYEFKLNDCFLVLMQTNLQTAVDRMQARSKHQCDFKSLAPEELKKIYHSYLSVFAEFDFDLTINSNNVLATNVVVLREWINDL